MIKVDKENVSKNIMAFLQFQRKFGYDFSQAEIAAETGITQSQLSNYESGKMLPSLLAVMALANMFDVSIDYLVGRCENKLAHKTPKAPTKFREDELNG